MSLRPMSLLAASAALLLGTGCPKDEPTPENDRTLQRLKQEADRVAAGGPAATPPPERTPSQDPNAALAELAAAQADKQQAAAEREKQLPLPEGNATVHVGTVAVKLLGLATSSVQRKPSVTLTTEELFLRVQLIAQDVGPQAAQLDLGSAKVTDGRGGQWPLARDVQQLVGTRGLSSQLAPSDRREYTLFFEVPRPGPAKGWSLLLPAPVGGEQDVSIPLR